MNDLKQFGHQGDTQWYQTEEITSSAKKIDKRFLAKSEKTGSVHALFGDYDLYEIENGFVINAHEECILNHTFESNITDTFDKPEVLPPKDHRHSVIPKGTYVVGIQQRFDPLENMKKKVID